MSDLKQLRDHAQAMAGPAAHIEGCCARYAFTRDEGITKDGLRRVIVGGWKTCADPEPHPEHDWHDAWNNGFEEVRSLVRCEGVCTGCVPEPERKLWRQIADEIGEHLDRPAEADQEALPL